MMAACQEHGQLTTNQVGYHLFDRRVKKAVLPYCRAQGIGFMAYGALAFGLLSGAFSPETRFVDWDWRSRGDAFGLPLFQREHFPQGAAVGGAAESAGGGLRQIRRATGDCLAAEPARGHGRAGGHAQPSANSRRMSRRPTGGLSADDCAAIERIFADEGIPSYRDVELLT